MDEISSEITKNKILLGFVVAFILLFVYYIMYGDEFDAEEYIEGLKEEYEGYTPEREIDYSCDEFDMDDFSEIANSIDDLDGSNKETIFRIDESNNVFKYHHLNDKVFTLKIEPGRYTGKKLAEALQKILNEADPEWWVKWDSKAYKFSLGANDFKYSRYLHKNSIYKTMGLKSPELFGLTAGTTEWTESETGSSLKIHR